MKTGKNPQSEQCAESLGRTKSCCGNFGVRLALLAGGGDKPYVFGLSMALASRGAVIDLIGSDELDCREFRTTRGINFLNLRGSTRHEASLSSKILRILSYHGRLIRYVTKSEPKILHILWNNKFEWFDRTLLMLYYKLLGKQIVLTAHNVNKRKRESNDTAFNRLTLWFQYFLADHLFVHTQSMKADLVREFAVPEAKVTVIPFGINNAVPKTQLTSSDAKLRLGLAEGEKAILFYGRIAPSKGLEYLLSAFRRIASGCDKYRLVIAGRPDNCEPYWSALKGEIHEDVEAGRIILRPQFIPDDETEIYFKAADAFVLPYRHVYESGVLYLGYSFGLPVIATDVGSFRDEIVEGKTGFICSPEDPIDLARAIECYFASDLYQELETRRQQVHDYMAERHSWEKVSRESVSVYAGLLRECSSVPTGGNDPLSMDPTGPFPSE